MRHRLEGTKPLVGRGDAVRFSHLILHIFVKKLKPYLEQNNSLASIYVNNEILGTSGPGIAELPPILTPEQVFIYVHGFTRYNAIAAAYFERFS